MKEKKVLTDSIFLRIPLLTLSNQQQQSLQCNNNINSINRQLLMGEKVSYSQVAKKPTTDSLADILNSVVVAAARTNNISPLSFGSNSSCSGSSSNSSSMMTVGNSSKPKMVTVKPSLDDVKVQILN
jgi:hypothetical protein